MPELPLRPIPMALLSLTVTPLPSCPHHSLPAVDSPMKGQATPRRQNKETIL